MDEPSTLPQLSQCHILKSVILTLHFQVANPILGIILVQVVEIQLIKVEIAGIYWLSETERLKMKLSSNMLVIEV